MHYNVEFFNRTPFSIVIFYLSEVFLLLARKSILILYLVVSKCSHFSHLSLREIIDLIQRASFLTKILDQLSINMSKKMLAHIFKMADFI